MEAHRQTHGCFGWLLHARCAAVSGSAAHWRLLSYVAGCANGRVVAAMDTIDTLVTTRLHVQATTAAEVQRATPEGQKETDGLGEGFLLQVSASPDGDAVHHQW